MNIELKNRHRSPKSESIYYDIYVDDKFYSQIRLSDHLLKDEKKNKKILFFWCMKPKNVKEGVVLGWVKKLIDNRNKQSIADNFLRY